MVEQYSLKQTDINQHLTTLYMLAVESNAKNILELGVRAGDSTIVLLQAANEIEGTVHSIDVAVCPIAKERVKEYGFEGHWHFIQGDDLQVQWDEPINLLFIDTSHECGQTLRELGKYEPFVIEGGIIILHDTVTFPDCGKGLEKYMRGRIGLKAYRYFNNNGLTVLFKRPI